ncbi:endonuclease/exonuclease/phosphatase family protein [Mongoliitalea daihaiensis]|uniref:endonuclease/exonuclease/phosphatase family protein n=1 Tax=Mongoliitalea daihaiensis TaxID=2782006 RepID=UPI001F415963|nr:endonuclease/exonuclease/phosphatase family protein [Mongoliitalea daihaiensis]UJP63412.1 endonuclease/exonuclease/phosphatase family protein [Mongoliitalea daihaiensis]
MKNYMSIIFALILIGYTNALMAQSYTIASYNIRFDNPGDTGNLWKDRLPHLVSLINFHEIAIFGTQEGLNNQLEDLAQNLGYAFIGSGRDDGGNTGEHSAIFYDPLTFKLLQKGDFWLSETPTIPSVGWDAAMNRICSFGQFQTEEGIVFWVFNAHYDHVGQKAREESSKLIMGKIKELNSKNDPVIFMGDLNVTPDNIAYKTIIQSDFLKDSYELSEQAPHGPIGTFNAFNWDMMPDRRIDYIFVSEQIGVTKYAVLSDNYGKKYPSDHFPVFARIWFK